MNTLGIYIYNSTRNQWYTGGSEHRPGWGSFADAIEFTVDDPEVVERLRESITGDDVTFTMAALH